MKITENEPCYPIVDEVIGNYGEPCKNTYFGMTIRTELAARAMQGILANERTYASEEVDKFLIELANLSVRCADALIEELNKQNRP